MNIKTKICSNKKCIHGGKPQPLSNFNKNKNHKDGYTSNCKDCIKKQKDKYYQENKEKVLKKCKEYSEKNRDAVLENKRNYYDKNKEKIKDTSQKNYWKNRDKNLEQSKQYRKDHQDKIKEKKKENYDKNKEDILLKQKDYRNSLALYDSWSKKLNENLEECQRDPKNTDLLQVRCKYCGKWMNPTVLEVQHRIESIKNGFINGERNFYCSESCKHNCPIFGQHKYPKGYTPASSNEVRAELRKMVLERDNWTCQKCEKNKEEDPELSLHCHHIDPVVNNPIESADVDNCITLCEECHKWIHSNIPGCTLSELIKCGKNKSK